MVLDEIQSQHLFFTLSLKNKGLIVHDEKTGLIKPSSEGYTRITKLLDNLSMEDITLLLVAVCDQEGFKYHIIHGVVKSDS